MAPNAIALSAPAGKSDASASLTRAALEVYEAVPAEGGSKPGGSIDRIPFQFNPKELSISKSAKWERKTAPAASNHAGPPEFTGADACKLTLELFFDATDTMDGKVVSPLVDQLFHCCVPTDDSLAKKKALPPLVVRVGQGQELRRVRDVRAGQVHAVHGPGHADPCHLQRVDRGDARQPAQAVPDVRRPRVDLGAHGRRG